MKVIKSKTGINILKKEKLTSSIIEEEFNLDYLSNKGTMDVNKKIFIENCIFNEDFFALNFFKEDFIIINCYFKKRVVFTGAMFYKKVKIESCEFKTNVELNAGIYFMGRTQIKNNIFNGFVEMTDSEFKESLILKNNKFKKGTDLLGNPNKPYQTKFNKEPVIENNNGDLKMDILA